MKNIFMISPAFLKEYMPEIDNNVDDDLFETSIIEAQEIQLREITGQKLYESLLDKIDNDTLSGDTTYNNLFENYCLKVVLYQSISYAFNRLSFKINNKNVGVKDGDNTANLTAEQYEILRSDYNNKMEYYSQRLINYLCSNSSLFSEYGTETDDEITPNERSVYFNGMDLTAKNKPCRRYANL